MCKKYKNEILSWIVFVVIFVGCVGMCVYKCFIDNSSWTSIISLIYPIALPSLLTWFYSRHLQRQKGILDKDVEKYKHELQVEFIKVEVKTKQLFIIYPEMFALFKKSEAELLILRGPVERRRPVEQKDIREAEKVLFEANNFLVFNLLFISEETKSLAISLKDSMGKCLYGAEKFSVVEKAIDKLEKQMKLELKNNA